LQVRRTNYVKTNSVHPSIHSFIHRNSYPVNKNNPEAPRAISFKMSFLGIGRQQPTSEQKIAAVEGEMRMMADTYNRYVKNTPPTW
jgi:hypothetical protein